MLLHGSVQGRRQTDGIAGGGHGAGLMQGTSHHTEGERRQLTISVPVQKPPFVHRRRRGGLAHLRQDKLGFLLITQRYAAIGSSPC
jgi:hypothetical protein